MTRIVDRLTGDRADYPHLVARGCAEALFRLGYGSHILYGRAAWVEVLEDQKPIWAIVGPEPPYFWVENQLGETIDLNASVGHRRRPKEGSKKSAYSPPILWSKEKPAFYFYQAEGVAEIDPQDEKEARWWQLIQKEIEEWCVPEKLAMDSPEFPNEPILCPHRMLLDDTEKTFQHFDRALSVYGLPPLPFEN